MILKVTKVTKVTNVTKVAMNEINTKRIRRNAIIGGIILSCIATLHFFKGHTGFYRFLYAFAGFLFIAGGFFPKIFKRITDAAGGFIVSVFLSVIFFTIITPIGVVMRLFGKDTLDKYIDAGKDSYWINKPQDEDISGLEKQY